MSEGYIVAISKKEAAELARDRPDLVHLTKREANQHLADVKAPPTDPYYANQYKVYKVNVAE